MANRVHVRIEGTIGTPAVEEWSIGVNYDVAGGAGAGDQGVVQALATDFASYLATSTAYATALAEMSTSVLMTRVSVYGYQGSGPAASGAQANITPAKAGAGAISHPFQTTRCISLQTSLPGARYRGRFYVPALSASIAASGKSGMPSGFLQAWALVLEQPINLWTGSSPLTLGVYSAVADVVTPVTQIRGGDVLDTQRRRRDALQETYTVVPV